MTASGFALAHPVTGRLGYFDGFPYLITRLVPTLYHVILLPEDLTPEECEAALRRQADVNRLQTCLVLAHDRGLYVSSDGEADWSDSIPRGGVLVIGRLQPCRTFAATRNLVGRRAQLDRLIAAQPREGFMLGDLTKGGRKATFEESVMLAGRQPNGVPRGLSCCRNCGKWRGLCLDPDARNEVTALTVHCRCQNDNRCAACGRRLYERRLNANYYNAADGKVWHVPGFSALSHVCSARG